MEKYIPKKNPEMVARVIGKETVLLPIFKSTDEMNCIYSLNPSASSVWQIIDGKRPVGQIIKRICASYAAAPDQCKRKIQRLLKEFKEARAIL